MLRLTRLSRGAVPSSSWRRPAHRWRMRSPPWSSPQSRFLATMPDPNPPRRHPSAEDRASPAPALAFPEASPTANPRPALDRQQPEEEEGNERNLALVVDRKRKCCQVVRALSSQSWGPAAEDALVALSIEFRHDLVIKVLSAGLPPDTALGFFRWLEAKNGFSHSLQTCGSMLNLLGRSGRMKEMLALFEELRGNPQKISLTTYTFAMTWLSKAKDFEGAVTVWKKMLEDGLQPRTQAYTALIDICAESGEFERVSSVYMAMLEHNSLPNARTISVLIDHLVKAGQVDAAAEIFGLHLPMRFAPNIVTFRTLVDGYAKAGNANSALRYVRWMKEYNHRPNRRMSMAVKALQEAGKSEEAALLFEELWPDLPAEEREAELNNLLNSTNDDEITEDDFGSLRRVQVAESIPRESLDSGDIVWLLQQWSPVSVKALELADLELTSSVVYEVLKKMRSSASAWEFLAWVKTRPGFSRHDSYTSMLMVEKLLQDGKLGFVEELLDGKDHGQMLTLSTPLVNIVMRHCISSGKLEKAEWLLSTGMPSLGLKPNEFSYLSIVRALVRQGHGHQAMALYEEMQKLGLQPDVTTFKALIKWHSSLGKVEGARSLFENMLKLDMRPDAQIFEALLGLYYRLGMQEATLHIYDSMRNMNVIPTLLASQMLTEVLRRAGRGQEADELTELVRTKVQGQGQGKASDQAFLLAISIFTDNMPKKSAPPQR